MKTVLGKAVVVAIVSATMIGGAAAQRPPKITRAQGVEHGDLRLDVDTPRTLAWADGQTARTLLTMERTPGFDTLLDEAKAVLTQRGRIGELSTQGDWIYEYIQDEDRPLGIWRRSPIDEYSNGHPTWSTLLDLDELSTAERRKLFFAGGACRGHRCLVNLTENGRDAAETREYDLNTRTFVPGGFRVPPSKTRLWWFDDNTLLVAPGLKRERLTIDRLPAELKLWRRGTPLASAEQVFSISPSDVGISVILPNFGEKRSFIAVRHLDFVRREYTLVRPDRTKSALPLPKRSLILGVHKNRLLVRLDDEWSVNGQPMPFKTGDLVQIPLTPLLEEGSVASSKLVYSPEEGEAVRSATSAGSKLIVTSIKNYVSRLLEIESRGEGWVYNELRLPAPFVQPISFSQNALLMKAQGPLHPDEIMKLDLSTGLAERVLAQPAAFKTADLTTKIFQATSNDGTAIDYLVISKKDLVTDGNNPTLVYGYGGFDVPLTPRYEPLFGKLWLERGGVYVHAYLRGGGERGPAWHNAAIGPRHERAFEDMEAVLRDLHARRISSPAHTGIIGRSNGGLLTATVMERSPHLMNAVVIGGPLIDMLNFHRLPPGGTWAAEYGHPEISSDRDILLRYSPMQNVATSSTRYPIPLIITSRDDDRVLPGHARRFSQLLTRKGHKNYYYEDMQGGHYWELPVSPPAGDWRLRAVARAVEFSYLWNQLAPGRELGRK